MAWTKVTMEETDMVDFEVVKSLEGVLSEIRRNIGENNSNIYVVMTDDGELKSFWGTTVLDNKMSKVKLGSKIKIEFLGKKKGKSGRSYNDFDVFFDTDATAASPEDLPFE